MVTRAETSLVEVRVAEENTLGTVPSSKSGEVLRTTGITMSLDTETEESQELTGDRQRRGVARVGYSSGGGLDFELSFGTYNTLFEHLMLNEFEYNHEISGTLGSDSSNDQFTSDTASSGPDLSAIREGQVIRTSGFNDSSLNGEFTVTAIDKASTTQTVTVEENLTVDETGSGDEAIEYNFQTGPIDSDSGTNVFKVDTSVAGNPTFSGYSEGQWIRTGGFSNSDLNSYWYIDNVDTSTNTHKLTVRGSIPTTETGSGDENIGGQRIQNGTNKKSLFVEKEMTDTGDITYYTGNRMGGMDLDISQRSKITGSFSLTGINEVPANPSTQLSGSPEPANTNEIFSSADHVPTFYEGGQSLKIRSFNMSMDNKARDKAVVSTPENIGIGMGTIGISGSLEVYHTDGTLYQKYTNYTNTSFSAVMEDDSGNAYVLTIHNANFSDGDHDADSIDSDVIDSLDFTAKIDDNSNIAKMIQIDRFPNL